jgi:exonuclease VII large subunit
MNKAIRNAIDHAGLAVAAEPTDQDWQRYAHLLEHCNEDDPKEVAELAGLMKRLKRTDQLVREDVQALTEARKCETHFCAGKVQRQIGEAEDAIHQHEAETRRLLAELQARRGEEMQTLNDQLGQLKEKKELARRAAVRMGELRRGGKTVIAHIPAPDVKDLDALV